MRRRARGARRRRGARPLQTLVPQRGRDGVRLDRQRRPPLGVLAQEQRDRRGADELRGVARRRRQPRPAHLAGQAQRVEHRRLIAVDAIREDRPFPGVCRELEAVERFEHRSQPVHAGEAARWGDVLPREQEAHEIGGADRFDLGAEPVERVAVDPRQQPAVAPFRLLLRASRASRSKTRRAGPRLRPPASAARHRRRRRRSRARRRVPVPWSVRRWRGVLAGAPRSRCRGSTRARRARRAPQSRDRTWHPDAPREARAGARRPQEF